MVRVNLRNLAHVLCCKLSNYLPFLQELPFAPFVQVPDGVGDGAGGICVGVWQEAPSKLVPEQSQAQLLAAMVPVATPPFKQCS